MNAFAFYTEAGQMHRVAFEENEVKGVVRIALQVVPPEGVTPWTTAEVWDFIWPGAERKADVIYQISAALSKKMLAVPSFTPMDVHRFQQDLDIVVWGNFSAFKVAAGFTLKDDDDEYKITRYHGGFIE